MPKSRKPTMAHWIERSVVLPREVCASPGPMRLWPWHKGIVEAIEDPSIERITLVKPVRVGFSTLLHAVTAYYIVKDPAPILSVLPTDADCRRVMVSELERIFEASAKLRGKLPAPKLGDRTGKHRSTILHRLFDGGSLHMVAARAPRNLRGPTARILIVDEVDGMAMTDEGSPIDLAVDRTTSFDDRKIIIGSTPGDEETSLILPLYAQSDRRVFEVPCPDCGTFTEILWQHIEWEPNRPHTAAFRCPSCVALVQEHHKPAMVKNGHWRASASPANGHAGFRLNSLVSTLANASWGKLAADFLLKKDDPERLRTFVNRFLGQGWRDDSNSVDESELAARAEPFGLEGIPPEVIAITIGVDVQDDRLEPTIAGWTRTGQCLVLAHEPIYGPVDSEAVWQDLDDLLKSRWRHPHGGPLKVDAAVIDAGDGGHYDRVMDFCAARARSRVLAGKGVAGFGRPAIRPSTSGKVRGGRRLWLIGVDGIKQSLFTRLAKGSTIRFSHSLEADYYEQVTSERRVVKMSRGKPVARFERITGRRAEALDALVMASAAKAVLSINPEARQAELAEAAPGMPRPGPQVIRSSWMAR
jgi:phage terminase large subunit GpA-like protein